MLERVREREGGKLHGQNLRDRTERSGVRICSHFSSEASADSKSTDADKSSQRTQGTKNTVVEIRSTTQDGSLQAPGLQLGLWRVVCEE